MTLVDRMNRLINRLADRRIERRLRRAAARLECQGLAAEGQRVRAWADDVSRHGLQLEHEKVDRYLDQLEGLQEGWGR